MKKLIVERVELHDGLGWKFWLKNKKLNKHERLRIKRELSEIVKISDLFIFTRCRFIFSVEELGKYILIDSCYLNNTIIDPPKIPDEFVKKEHQRIKQAIETIMV